MRSSVGRDGHASRVLYLRDYQSERLIRDRQISRNIHSGATAKAARMATALAFSGCDVSILATGIPANRSFRFYGAFQDVVKGTDIPVFYAPAWDVPVLSHLVALLYFVYFILRFKRPTLSFVCNLPALSVIAACVLKICKRSRVSFEYDDDCYMSLDGARLRSYLRGAISMFFAKRVASGFVCINRVLAVQCVPAPTYVLEGIVDVEGIATSRFTPDAERSEYRLAYTGGINPLKGVMNLPEIMQGLGNGYSLDIVGGGPLLQSLKDVVATGQLENVCVHGFLDTEGLNAISARADIFINPHLTHLGHSDSIFPSKVIEYLAYGKPVVSTKLTACSPSLQRGIVTAADDTVIAMTDAVKDCAEHYAELAGQMREVQEYVWAHHSVEGVGPRLRKFLMTEESSTDQDA